MSTVRIRDYRDLLAWQKAIDLALLCDEMCEGMGEHSPFVTTQIRRAANSVHSNIAEGNGRFSRPDYLRHLSIASGSLRELESNLHFISRGAHRPRRIDDALALCHLATKLLAGLIRSLRVGGGKRR